MERKSIFGALIGGAAGAVVAGPRGAMLGAAMGAGFASALPRPLPNKEISKPIISRKRVFPW